MRAGDAFAIGIFGLAGGFGLLLVLGSRIPIEVPRPWEAGEPSPPATPRPVPTREPRPVPPADPDAYRERVGTLKEFGKQELGDVYLLNFGFIDHHGKTHRVSCEVAKAAHAQELDGFGYDKDDVQKTMQAYIDDELKRRDLARFVRANAKGAGGWHYDWELPPGLPTDEEARRLGDIQSFATIFQDEFPRRCRLLLKERGFLFGKTIEIDYAGVVRRSTPHLRNCFDALQVSGLGYNERQYLGLFVAFLQEIPYQLPPDRIGRRQIQGFWVPTEVLVGDHGDCDSKSATFAALWRNFRSSVILIEIPDHMLVGVEVRPRAGEKYVLVKNHYYVLGEVAGGKRHPGDEGHEMWQQISGHFEYTVVNPAERAGT